MMNPLNWLQCTLLKYKPVIFVQYLYFPALFTLLTFWLLCCRVLYDKRFSAFHYPVTDEDAPNYRSIIQNPMDMATMLQRVDSGQYITCSAFLQDIDLIVTNAKVCLVSSCIRNKHVYSFVQCIFHT
jgi:hypothetical protein